MRLRQPRQDGTRPGLEACVSPVFTYTLPPFLLSPPLLRLLLPPPPPPPPPPPAPPRPHPAPPPLSSLTQIQTLNSVFLSYWNISTFKRVPRWGRGGVKLIILNSFSYSFLKHMSDLFPSFPATLFLVGWHKSIGRILSFIEKMFHLL